MSTDPRQELFTTLALCRSDADYKEGIDFPYAADEIRVDFAFNAEEIDLLLAALEALGGSPPTLGHVDGVEYVKKE